MAQIVLQVHLTHLWYAQFILLLFNLQFSNLLEHESPVCAFISNLTSSVIPRSESASPRESPGPPSPLRLAAAEDS